MSAIQGTIKFVNKSKLNPTTNKWSQSIKVAVPGGADVYVNGPSGSFDTYLVNQQVMIEQDGKWWRLAKDQSGLSVTAPGATAPMSATPATVTNGQGYAAQGVTPATKENMIAWADACAEMYLHILDKITLSRQMADIEFGLQKEAAATIYIAAVKRFERP